MNFEAAHELDVYEVRRLTPSDAAQYRELMLSVYGSHPHVFTSTISERAALPISWWQSRLSPDREAREAVFGAIHRDRLIGLTGLAFRAREKVRHKATLFGLYVAPDSRNRGIGKRLVSTALEHAKGRSGIRIVQLTVTEGNAAAIALYHRCGFAEFGREPFAVAVGSEFVARLHMWRAVDAADELLRPDDLADGFAD